MASNNEDELEQLTQLEEVMITFVHDISQPLSSVMNYIHGVLRRLKQGDLSEQELVTALQQAVKQGELAASLVQRMRDFVNQPNVAKTYLDMTEVVGEVVRLMLPAIQEKKIKLSLTLEVKDVFVLGDEVQLKRVLTNLFANALDAMSSRAVRLLSVSACLGNDKQVLITIKDTGQGIPTKKLKKIFMPFYTTKSKGMGMGLAICHSIVEKHHGKLWAQSEEEVGTTFYLSLPVAKS